MLEVAAVSADKRSDDEHVLVIAGRVFRSRLIIGTGKYTDYAVNAQAAEAAGVDAVTVALRRVNLSEPDRSRLSDHLDPERYAYIPNTAGCFTAEEGEAACADSGKFRDCPIRI